MAAFSLKTFRLFKKYLYTKIQKKTYKLGIIANKEMYVGTYIQLQTMCNILHIQLQTAM